MKFNDIKSTGMSITESTGSDTCMCTNEQQMTIEKCSCRKCVDEKYISI